MLQCPTQPDGGVAGLGTPDAVREFIRTFFQNFEILKKCSFVPISPSDLRNGVPGESHEKVMKKTGFTETARSSAQRHLDSRIPGRGNAGDRML